MSSKVDSAIYHPIAQRHSRPGANFHMAFMDVLEGISSVHVWSTLGWQDVKQRYRRSLLGPFWLTISTGLLLVVIFCTTAVQSDLGYLPAVSFIAWQLLSSYIRPCNAFIGAEGSSSIRLPLTVHVMRLIWKNLIFSFITWSSWSPCSRISSAARLRPRSRPHQALLFAVTPCDWDHAGLLVSALQRYSANHQ
jgi:hypothetical protein